MRTRQDARIALYIDLENLVYPEVDGGALALEAAVRSAEAVGTVVASVAVCDRALARRLTPVLARLGVRPFVHAGGTDAADRVLLYCLETQLPRSCDTVVIASGDHIFAPAVRALRAGGRRVHVFSRPGAISADLYVSADEWLPLEPLPAA